MAVLLTTTMLNVPWSLPSDKIFKSSDKNAIFNSFYSIEWLRFYMKKLASKREFYQENS